MNRRGVHATDTRANGTDLSFEGTKREVVTDAGVLRYHEAGDGPPLLLLHGSGIGVSGWRNYRGNLAVFAEHFHCYVLEFPGFGISDPVEGHPVRAATESVPRFMDALGSNPPRSSAIRWAESSVRRWRCSIPRGSRS
ncbi:hypothetical protein GS545_26010 [Rhodococcus hoagii]|nr:hypothetical protein [Prescottella equi]